MHRRTFLSGLGGTLAVAGQPVLSQTAIGTATLTTVSDGSLTLPPGMIFDPMPQDELPAILQAYGQPQDRLTPECNLTLWRTDSRTVLFDAGSGPDFMPSAGKLIDSLDAAGLAPEDITDVVFTHAHPDHIWGVLDDFGDPLFYEATHHIGRAEHDYWMDPNTVDSIGAARASFAVGARRRLQDIADQLQVFEEDQEVLPGIIAVPSPGHTPGHMSFVVADGNASALILGDAIGNHHVALARPEWPSGSDQDPDLAARTRLSLIDQITTDDLLVVGFHFPNGGVGTLERFAEGHRFQPG